MEAPNPANPAPTEPLPPQPEPPQQCGMGLTILFMLLLAGIYLYTSYPGFETVQNWAVVLGAFTPQGFADGLTEDNWWRWITGNLLHADFTHLLVNCFAIYIFGSMLEPPLGKLRYFGLLVAGGLGCDLATYFMSDSVSLGASGIGYALIGFYFMLVLLVTRRVAPEKFAGSLRSVIFVILLYIGADLMRPEVNMWGHLGGLVAGLLYGLVLVSGRLKAST